MILCADDYGISPGVSRGILELMEAGRLSATSCMVGFPNSEEDMRQLRGYRQQTDIGLHLVLPDHEPLASHSEGSGWLEEGGRFPEFSKLARLAYRRRLDIRAISREFAAQVRRFVELLGFAPDFIDGHQHVQQLPVVRTAVAEALGKNGALQDTYVRIGSRPFPSVAALRTAPSRSTVLGGYGISLPSRGASSVFRSKGVRTNRYLLGYYPPGNGIAFQEVFSWYANQAPSGRDVFFCHPGRVDSVLGTRDSITSEREDALRFLSSDDFGGRLACGEAVLNRFDGAGRIETRR